MINRGIGAGNPATNGRRPLPVREEQSFNLMTASSERRRTSDPEELSLGRAFRLYGRALSLRCPSCGEGSIRESWFKLRRNCPTCGIRTERGEEDFFLGAMMFNLVLSEGLLVAAMIAVGVLTWPAVPWNLLWFGGIALMVVAPILFYPASHSIWLASDILIRPVSTEELDWHRTQGQEEFRPLRDR
jgi:uncharacterized protein (DUF983 family)